MIAGKSAVGIIVDSSRDDYSPEKIFALLRDNVSEKVWNFLPGFFVVRTAETEAVIHEKLGSKLQRYFLVRFDPAHINGNLPEPAWDSWFLDVFSEDADHISEYNGWDAEILRSTIANFQKNS